MWMPLLAMSGCESVEEPAPTNVDVRSTPPAIVPSTPSDTGGGGTSPSPPMETEPQGLLQFDGPAPTNLVIISLDTTRRDHVGRYGAMGDTPKPRQRAGQRRGAR